MPESIVLSKVSLIKSCLIIYKRELYFWKCDPIKFQALNPKIFSSVITVNDRLNAWGDYIKIKTFRWVLIWAGCLIESCPLLKKLKKYNIKEYQTVNFS